MTRPDPIHSWWEGRPYRFSEPEGRPTLPRVGLLLPVYGIKPFAANDPTRRGRFPSAPKMLVGVSSSGRERGTLISSRSRLAASVLVRLVDSSRSEGWTLNAS